MDDIELEVRDLRDLEGNIVPDSGWADKLISDSDLDDDEKAESKSEIELLYTILGDTKIDYNKVKDGQLEVKDLLAVTYDKLSLKLKDNLDDKSKEQDEINIYMKYLNGDIR